MLLFGGLKSLLPRRKVALRRSESHFLLLPFIRCWRSLEPFVDRACVFGQVRGTTGEVRKLLGRNPNNTVTDTFRVFCVRVPPCFNTCDVRLHGTVDVSRILSRAGYGKQYTMYAPLRRKPVDPCLLQRPKPTKR